VRDAAKLCVMPGLDDWRARAQRISDDLLFPASAEVDAAELVPRGSSTRSPQTGSTGSPRR